MKKGLFSISIVALIALFITSCASAEVRAVRQGNLEDLQEYIRDGGDPNAVQNNGQALLHIAVEFDQLQSLLFLLDSGAQPDPRDRQGASPLLLAAGKGRLDMVEALAARGADVNLLDNASRNSLFYAVGSGRFEVLQFLLSSGVNPRHRDGRGRTLLHLLTSNSQSSIAARLMLVGSDPSARETTNGYSALHIAARAGAYELVELYIDNDGPEIIGIEDNQGNRALFLSLNPDVSPQDGRRTLETLLVNGADPNEPGRGGRLPIVEAVERLDSQRVEILIEYGAALEPQLGNEGSLLHIAVRRDDPGITEVLLQSGANPNIPDGNRQTPIFIAAIQPSTAVFSLLLEGGAQVNRFDDMGMTPFTLALGQSADQAAGLTAQARIMRDQGAALSTSEEMLAPILARSLFRGNEEVADIIFGSGFDVDYQDDEGASPLIRAVIGQRVNMVNVVLDYQPRIDIGDDVGKTALMYAVERQSNEIVRILLQNGANVFAADRQGNSVIHFAVISGDPESVRALLIAGADPNLPNRQGRTPYQLAGSNPRSAQVREILILAGAVVPAEAEIQNPGDSTQDSGDAANEDQPTKGGESSSEERPIAGTEGTQDEAGEDRADKPAVVVLRPPMGRAAGDDGVQAPGETRPRPLSPAQPGNGPGSSAVDPDSDARGGRAGTDDSSGTNPGRAAPVGGDADDDNRDDDDDDGDDDDDEAEDDNRDGDDGDDDDRADDEDDNDDLDTDDFISRPDIRLTELFDDADEPRQLRGPRTRFEGYSTQIFAQYPRNFFSQENNREVRLYFYNDSGQSAELFFINATGNPVPVYRLGEDEELYLDTLQGNVIVIYGQDGSYFGEVRTTGQAVQGFLLLSEED